MDDVQPPKLRCEKSLNGFSEHVRISRSWREDLNEILRNSIERGSRSTKRIYSTRPMSIDELLAYFDRIKVATFASVRPSGAPHVVPVSFIHCSGRIYVNTNTRSVRYKNIRSSNRVALTFLEGSKVVILEGIAMAAGSTGEFIGGEIGGAFLIKYGKERRVTPDSVMMEIIPSKILTYRGRISSDEKKN